MALRVHVTGPNYKPSHAGVRFEPASCGHLVQQQVG